MRVLLATRESPEEMSRMFTENVCMDFDQLILALVQLLRTLRLGDYRSGPDTPRNLA
jgi:hypothetical protein